MPIATSTSNAALTVIVMMAVASGVSAAPLSPVDDTKLPRSAQPALFAAAQPTAPATTAPYAKPSTKPRPTQKPKPTPKPTPVPTPIRRTPRPTVARVTPRPTATRPPTPIATARATATSSTPAAGTPAAVGAMGEPPLGTGATGDVTIPVALITAAVGVLVLVRVARRRFIPETVDAGPEPAVSAPPAPEPHDVEPTPERTGEEHLPRWRRPSVVAARFETVNTAAIKAAAATLAGRLRPAQRFASGAVIDEDLQRFVIRYDGVALLDRPDDVHGRATEYLLAEDEVALLDRDELWANVTTPRGRAGWIPVMALGPAAAPAADAAADAVDARERPASPEPTRAGEQSASDETVIDSLLANRPTIHPEQT